MLFYERQGSMPLSELKDASTSEKALIAFRMTIERPPYSPLVVRNKVLKVMLRELLSKEDHPPGIGKDLVEVDEITPPKRNVVIITVVQLRSRWSPILTLVENEPYMAFKVRHLKGLCYDVHSEDVSNLQQRIHRLEEVAEGVGEASPSGQDTDLWLWVRRH